MIQNWKFQRGDIFFTRFDNAIGSEQSGNRPAVVLQNDVGNFYSPTLIVATLTSKAAKKYTQPTHCLLVNEFLSVPSIVQAEQIFTVDKSRVLKFLGHLTPEEMDRGDDAVRASLALNPMGSIQRLPPIIRSTAAYAPPEVVDGKPPLYPYTPIKSSFEDAGSVEDMMRCSKLGKPFSALTNHNPPMAIIVAVHSGRQCTPPPRRTASGSRPASPGRKAPDTRSGRAP